MSPFPDEVLTEEEVNDILETAWLSNAHINCGITILIKSIAPESIGGLYKVQLMVHDGFPVVTQSKWIQILLIGSGGSGHWLVAAYGFNNHPFVTLYDSKIPNGRDVNIHSSVFKAVQQLTGVSEPSVRYMPCQFQQDGFNCGVFALCFATSLASGGDPSKQKFIQSEMRNHLKKCLIKPKDRAYGLLVPFPEEVNLTAQHLLDASLNNNLSECHMNAAARLIKNTFHDIGGLYDVNLMTTGFPYGNEYYSPELASLSKWMQFLPRKNGHWILAASGFNNVQHRMLYDISNFKGADKAITPQVVTAVAQLHFNYSKFLEIGYMPFSPGTSNSSGIVTIAIAVALLFGRNPATIKFGTEQEMKKHLVNCFKAGKISLFPTVVKGVREKKSTPPKPFELFCVCRMPCLDAAEDVLMVQCSHCKEWFHQDHHVPEIPMSSIKNKKEEWFCCDCIAV